MAIITISELRPRGAELFDDSETFLTELSNEETGNVIGGIVIITKTILCFSGRRCRLEAQVDTAVKSES